MKISWDDNILLSVSVIFTVEITMSPRAKAVLEPYLTVNDVCKYLKISNESLYGWIKNTDIPAHKVGKRWLFSKDELDAWVRSDGLSRKTEN